MSVLSVRIPKDLATKIPRKDRSAWVIEAIRQQLRRQKIHQIAASAGRNAKRDSAALADWEPATAPLSDER
jgi:hypothetical protein